MYDDKWFDVLDKIKEDFELIEQKTETIENIPNSKVETVIFVSPAGKMKLVRTTRPRVLDKKTVYSNRAGSSMNVNYIYAENEFTYQLEVYKWDEISDDWIKARIDL